KAPVESQAVKRRRFRSIRGEPLVPLHPLYVRADKRLIEEIGSLSYRFCERGRAERRDRLLRQRNNFDTLRARRAVDDVDIEIIVAEACVVGVCSQPNLKLRVSSEKLCKPWRQPLRSKAGCGMDAHQLWPARGNFLQATAELIECGSRVTHQV